ncbi:MAG: DUF4150 domain-containing protein [Candidatus Electrothrix sp. GM3_4]|nr:DUF4150 domain-containing protein [Candidatus Electrothrix sp. GM3_4]
MSVGVNPPKTPITKGSLGTAAATLPNMCKMPGPPAPFVLAPLPNIGKSGDKPKKYTKNVKVERKKVAVKGASFCSMGDMPSKGTGGGMTSANTHGSSTFISPGSMDVKFEGKNVHLLSDLVTNNGAGSGSPSNSATMMGTIQNAFIMDAFKKNPENEDVCGPGQHKESVQFPNVPKSEWHPNKRLAMLKKLAKTAEQKFEVAAAKHNIDNGTITHGSQISRPLTPEEKKKGLHSKDQEVTAVCKVCGYRREIEHAPNKNSTVEAKSTSAALKASKQKANNLSLVQKGKTVTYKAPPLSDQKKQDLVNKGFNVIKIIVKG